MLAALVSLSVRRCWEISLIAKWKVDLDPFLETQNYVFKIFSGYNAHIIHTFLFHPSSDQNSPVVC